ncbi:MAG TPA: methyltransferase domain-containing protein [Streptosporangiaceae bacterium]|nr:methyltransferase domain-containing protein [Streptosporangiaceae bacterium]
MGTGNSAEYVLGGSDAERARLRAQADEHEASARSLLKAVGIRQGSRVLDVGCGPIGILALLADAVGPTGEVVGLERERRFVEMARAEVARLGLENVTVVEGDALSSGLDRGSFDFVHERLVMVNVPERRELLAEMVSLAAPGGGIALEDIDNVSWICEPAHESWTALLGAFHDVFRAGGGDPFVGRRLPALLREAGLADMQVRVQAALPEPGQYRRTHLLALIDSVRDKVVASGVMDEAELAHHRAALSDHLAAPTTLVIDKLLVQCWGHKPA